MSVSYTHLDVYKRQGVGLFRTEFLYMESAQLPTEEEQFNVYKEVLNLPLFPTTTIGSFPQTSDVKLNRKAVSYTHLDVYKRQDRNSNCYY